MGCVIFTNEPSDYEKGEVVYLGSRITEPPVREGVTYILEGSLTKEEAEMFASYIHYRMVVCCKLSLVLKVAKMYWLHGKINRRLISIV